MSDSEQRVDAAERTAKTSVEKDALGARIFAENGPWLFGKNTDLLAFGGSAFFSLAVLAGAIALGLPIDDAPEWLFFVGVLAVDVAHVWCTLFRVYFDGEAFRERRALFVGLPIALYLLGVVAHAVSSDAFWRVLAYVAVFHFVRQQVGWMRLYSRRDPHETRLGRFIDSAAIYLSTLYPVIYWHGHLPRGFHWFIEGDFVEVLSSQVSAVLFPVYVAALVTFVLYHLRRAMLGRGQPGKVLLLLSTAACWYVGIVALNSDFAFTITNVFIHGVPYFVLTFRYGRMRAEAGEARLSRMLSGSVKRAALVFLSVVLGFAVIEEFFWDRLVWQERADVFGEGLLLFDGVHLPDSILLLVVPLLSLPQLTHYALDGIIWRRKNMPGQENFAQHKKLASRVSQPGSG